MESLFYVLMFAGILGVGVGLGMLLSYEAAGLWFIGGGVMSILVANSIIRKVK